MSELPERSALEQLICGLSEALPGQLEVLLAHPRYADEATAIARLADPARRAAAVGALEDREVAWLLDALRSRWQAVGEVVLPPVCAVGGPRDVWLTEGSREVVLDAVVDGLESGWAARWTVRGVESDGPRVVVPITRDDDVLTVHLAVEGRRSGGRVLLDATHELVQHTPTVVLEQEGRVLLVRDQHGRPGAGLAVSVGGRTLRTDAQGCLQLDPSDGETTIEVLGPTAER